MSHSSRFSAVDQSLSKKTYQEIVPTWVFHWIEQDDDWIWKVAAIACGGLLSYHFYQKFQQEREEKELAQKELELANHTLSALKGKLLEMETNDLELDTAETEKKPKKQIRVWLDGVFDMMHFGHMNAFRQARSLGTHLVAGVCSSEDTARAKGNPVCSDEERINTVRGCKWVDEIVSHVSYTPDYSEIIEKHNIDYIVHGDDLCIVDGVNVYESAMKLGKFLTIPRTEGISTTAIVGRMLSIHNTAPNAVGSVHHTTEKASDSEIAAHHFVERPSEYLTTARIVRLFGAGVKPPKPTDRVVYIAGTFDMFHAGHVEILEKARKLGDYLIVGVYNDQIANSLAGANFPVLSMFERILSVLGCKFADDVLFNASYVITQEMISSLNIQVVAQPCMEGNSVHVPSADEVDPYVLPRKQGILQTVTYQTKLSVYDYINRIEDQRDRFETRFIKKMEKEKEFYHTKYHL